MRNKQVKKAVNEVLSLSHAEFNSSSRCLKAERIQIKFGMTLCNNNAFTRPSSFRKVSMRNIGAAHALYPAFAVCKTGVTERVASGFTLIELLVVVLIIGILASVALPQYNKAVKRARIAEVRTTLAAIRDAQLRKNMEEGTSDVMYPFEELDISFTNSNGNAATGDRFTNKDFDYQLVSDSAVIWAYNHNAVSTSEGLDYTVEAFLDGRWACFSNAGEKFCKEIFSNLKQGEAGTACTSGSWCFVMD